MTDVWEGKRKADRARKVMPDYKELRDKKKEKKI